MCLLVLFLCIASVLGRECLNSVAPNESCIVSTPANYNCSKSFDLVDLSDGNILIDDGNLSLINSENSICYLNFSYNTGDYSVILGEDNSTRTIVVEVSELDVIQSNTETIINSIGDPSGNETSLWDWLFIPVAESCSDLSGITRLWCFYWRTINAIEP
jgi:hypothetical protein